MSSLPSDPQPRTRLTEARIQHDWSQQALADRLGTTHVNVSRWERGLTRPNPYYRNKLCKILGKTEEELDLSSKARAATLVSTRAVAPAEQPSALETETSSAPTPLMRNVIYDPAIPLAPAYSLVGRDSERTALRSRLLAGGSGGLTALNGLPGVGKTALSIDMAHDLALREHFVDGILWAALGPEPNIPGQLSRWGSLLGISASEMAALNSNDAWARAIHSAIGSRRMLLVIDDAWHVEEALTLKVGGPHCSHLVTTRFAAIAIQIAGDGAQTIKELDAAQSIELLGRLAPEVIKREEHKAQDLVQAVGGLPLALTLMGNYLRKQAYSGQARRINTALERLSSAAGRLQISEPRGPVEAHPSLAGDVQQLSLQSVIAVTDQQLGREEQAALYALSVFQPKPNSFTEEAAIAVADCGYETIDLLADTGLLESSGEGRYTLHQTIADYTRLQLQDQAPHERLIAYALSIVEANKKDYELLEKESNTILAALDSAYQLDQKAALIRLANAFVPYMLLRGIYQLAERNLQRAYEAASALQDQTNLINILLYQGKIAQKLGNLAEATTYFQRGLTLAQEIDDKEHISALLGEIGWVTGSQGNFVQAEKYLLESLEIARQIHHSEQICIILRQLGGLTIRYGEYDKSETYLQEGIKIARKIDDKENLSILLMNLGVTMGEQGHYDQVEAYFQEGLTLARQIGHRERISALLSNLGDIATAQGNYIQAEIYFREGLALARQIGHREWTCVLLTNLGSVTLKLGNTAQAGKYLDESLALAYKIGINHITANVLYEYGNFYLESQRYSLAEQTFREMLTVIPEGGQDLLAIARYGLAQAVVIQQRIPEAINLAKESLATLEIMGNRKAQEVKEWLKKHQNQIEGK